MAPNRFMSEIDLIKTQLAVFTGIILLAVDTVNPVKIFLHVFPSILPWHIATICILAMIYLFISQMKEILYFSVKIFFHSILSIFFRDVELIGLHNVPRFGPVIFTVNHANQFIDAVTVLCTCERTISYLMAEKSWKRRIVGDLAWALNVVPVKRAQDDARPGTGTITFGKTSTTSRNKEETTTATSTAAQTADEDKLLLTVHGINTLFTKELNVGDKIRPPGTAAALKVVQIDNDTCLQVDVTPVPPIEATSEGGFSIFMPTHNNSHDNDNDHKDTQSSSSSSSSSGTSTAVPFDILKRVDQKEVYSKVLDKLADGGAIGIFPEGGSHDRTDLLPLKVGVALIAYSALEKDGINIPIVPVGLNYFQAHRWRGRAVVEYGRPILINPTTLKDYKMGGDRRRKVCNELLDRVQDSMKSVIISLPDYKSLQVIHTARRLYQRQGLLETSEKQDLNRRFAEGFKRLLTLTEGNPPQEWLQLQERIIAYGKELQALGLRDYQVPSLAHRKELNYLSSSPSLSTSSFSSLSSSSFSSSDGDHSDDVDTVLREMRVPYQILHLIVLFVLAAIPMIFINLPVGILAGIYAESRRKKALANSKVKVRGYDVMLTEKVVFCIVMVPTLWFMYGVLLYSCTNFDGPTLSLIISTMPIFAYMGIIVSEAGVVGWKDIRPHFIRLFPSSRQRLAALPSTRKQLQADLRSFIKDIGPALGEIYYSKHLDWHEILQKTRHNNMSQNAAKMPGTPTNIQKPTAVIQGPADHHPGTAGLSSICLKDAPKLDLTTTSTTHNANQSNSLHDTSSPPPSTELPLPTTTLQVRHRKTVTTDNNTMTTTTMSSSPSFSSLPEDQNSKKVI